MYVEYKPIRLSQNKLFSIQPHPETLILKRWGVLFLSIILHFHTKTHSPPTINYHNINILDTHTHTPSHTQKTIGIPPSALMCIQLLHLIERH